MDEVIPVSIPAAVYDAIVITIEEPLIASVCSNVVDGQHFLVWPDINHLGIAIALVRGKDTLLL